MNKITKILNPYSLLILAVFIKYYPTYFAENEYPSINIGPVSLYLTDISFIVLWIYAFFKLLRGQLRLPSRAKYEGKSIQIIFALFFALCCIKWLMQSKHDILSIRVLINFATAYPFLFFFPLLVTREDEVRKLQYFLIIFLVYIFILHLYAFSMQGYKMHILTGNFLSMLSLIYFLAASGRHVFALPPVASFCIKTLIITTYFMTGHRSGFVGLLLGLIMLAFFNKKLAVKEAVTISVIAVMGVSMASSLSPDVFSKLAERASTTFDTSQETYVGRYYQIFQIARLSMEEHPIIGRPLTSEARSKERITTSNHGTSVTGNVDVVTPHNLSMEWLYYYGSIGLLLGVVVVISGTRVIMRFLRENKHDRQNYQIGVAIVCSMVHNLFYALSNVTASSPFSTFFLYFPLIILVSISRNKESFYK